MAQADAAPPPGATLFVDCDDCLCVHRALWRGERGGGRERAAARSFDGGLVLERLRAPDLAHAPADARTHRYTNGWKTAKLLTARIEHFCTERLSLPEGKARLSERCAPENSLGTPSDAASCPVQAYQLYKTHGTALRGLINEGLMEESDTEMFLQYCHDVSLADIEEDGDLRAVLDKVHPSVDVYVFTASIREHAQRCLERLGLSSYRFKDIIDCRTTNLATKHSEEAYVLAQKAAGVEDASLCYFVDDSTSNMRAAKAVGWNTCLVGRIHRDTGEPLTSQHADKQVGTLHELIDATGWPLFSSTQ